MVGGTTGSACAGANAGVGSCSAGMEVSLGDSGIGICLVNIGVSVGYVVMGCAKASRIRSLYTSFFV